MESRDATPEYIEARALLGATPMIFDQPKLMTDEEEEARFQQMWTLYDRHSWSLSRVGRAFGYMTKERIRQIFNAHGKNARPVGGSAAYRELRRQRMEAQMRARESAAS